MSTGANDKLLLKEEVYRVVGCAMEVMNGVGPGLHEKPYENALAMEFTLQGVPFVQQPHLPILYKGRIVGEYVPDIVAFGVIVVDAKVIDCISDHERGQVMNYLRITRHKVGVILNFRRAKLEWERVVLDTARGMNLCFFWFLIRVNSRPFAVK